ncbi:MAG: hypothetical protein Q9184_005488 [Pyrenodesmia sp. 2 TL-2023]
MTRKVPKGSLSKASSRPLSTADGGRVYPTVTASTTPTLGRKSRNSVTSVDDPTKQRPDPSTSTTKDVEHKPVSSGRAESTSPVKFLLRSSSKRSTPGSSKREQSSTGSTLNGRFGTSPTPAYPMKNRSTSKTPSNRPTGATKAASIRAPSPLKRLRPGLGTRKSTMSVTIEQRLREMSLVHQMLHAAMAEEGDEDDEVKEAYGKQMDEQLAALKARLEVAREEEGTVHSGPVENVQPTANGPLDPTMPADEITVPTADDRQTNATADETDISPQEFHLREQEAMLLEQLEGVDVSALDDVSPRELKVAKLQLLKTRDDYESLQASTHGEISELRDVVDSLTDRLTSIQVSYQNKEREVATLGTTNEHLRAKVQELEMKICALRDELEGVQGQTDRELNHGQQVIKELQDFIRQLHETTEREILDVKLSLAQQHKKAVSTTEEMRSIHRIQQEELRAALASVHADNVKLRESLSSENDRSNQLQATLAEKEQALTATQDILDGLRQKHQQLIANHELELQTMRSLRQELERNRAEAQDVYEDLELNYVTMQSQLDAHSIGQDAVDQEITKVQIEFEKARDAEAKLDSELERAQAEAEKYKIKARELDSALKVTTAELVELRTERPSGSSYSGSPVPRAGLRSSRWAREDRNGDGDRDDTLGGQEPPTHSMIQGQMAAMKEYVKQMHTMNEETIAEHRRMIDKMERITTSPKASPAIAYRHVRPPSNGHVQKHTGQSTGDGDDEAQNS